MASTTSKVRSVAEVEADIAKAEKRIVKAQEDLEKFKAELEGAKAAEEEAVRLKAERKAKRDAAKAERAEADANGEGPVAECVQVLKYMLNRISAEARQNKYKYVGHVDEKRCWFRVTATQSSIFRGVAKENCPHLFYPNIGREEEVTISPEITYAPRSKRYTLTAGASRDFEKNYTSLKKLIDGLYDHSQISENVHDTVINKFKNLFESVEDEEAVVDNEPLTESFSVIDDFRTYETLWD